jgi:hypothetical protein
VCEPQLFSVPPDLLVQQRLIKPDRIIGAPSLEAGQVVEYERYQRARPVRRSLFTRDEEPLRDSLQFDADGTASASALAMSPSSQSTFNRRRGGGESV